MPLRIHRLCLKFAFVLALVTLMLSPKGMAKPNDVIIYTDDHRYPGAGAFSDQALQTPHLDQLAGEGFVFHNAYLMGSFSGATCIPSRAALHTGKHLFEMVQPGKTLPSEHTTIGEAFQSAGYSTHIIGKWRQDYGSLARSFISGDSLMGLSAYLTDHYRMPLWDWNPERPISPRRRLPARIR
jgi:hypothetical protein